MADRPSRNWMFVPVKNQPKDLKWEDLSFLAVVEQRAVWSVISRDDEHVKRKKDLHKAILEAIGSISERDLSRYVNQLVEKGYSVDDLQQAETLMRLGDKRSFREAHFDKLKAAFIDGPSKKRRKIS